MLFVIKRPEMCSVINVIVEWCGDAVGIRIHVCLSLARAVDVSSEVFLIKNSSTEIKRHKEVVINDESSCEHHSNLSDISKLSRRHSFKLFRCV